MKHPTSILLLLCLSVILMPLALIPQPKGTSANLRDQIIVNTGRLTDLERRVDAVEKEIAEHERVTTADPANIAVLQAQFKNFSDLQEKQLAVAGWALGGIGTLILGCIGVLLKRWTTRFRPPEWAQHEATQASIYREHISRGLDEVKQAAAEAKTAAKQVKDTLELNSK